MFTLALRRHMKGTKVKVLEVFPPAFATGLSVELESEGEKKTGPEAVANVAKTTVAGILAGEEQILPHPQSVQLFEGLRRSLRKGGVLLLHGYRPDQVDYGTGGPPYRENMYTETLLWEEFASLEVLRLEAYYAEIHEGHGHDGMSALIDLVARRI